MIKDLVDWIRQQQHGLQAKTRLLLRLEDIGEMNSLTARSVDFKPVLNYGIVRPCKEHCAFRLNPHALQFAPKARARGPLAWPSASSTPGGYPATRADLQEG